MRPKTVQATRNPPRNAPRAVPGRGPRPDRRSTRPRVDRLAGSIIAATMTSQPARKSTVASQSGASPSMSAWWWSTPALPLAWATITANHAAAIVVRTTRDRDAGIAVDRARTATGGAGLMAIDVMTAASDEVEAAAERPGRRHPDLA